MDEDFGTYYLADDYLTNTKPGFPETNEDDTDSKVLFFGISQLTVGNLKKKKGCVFFFHWAMPGDLSTGKTRVSRQWAC